MKNPNSLTFPRFSVLVILFSLSQNLIRAQQSIQWSHQLGSLYGNTNFTEKVAQIQSDRYGNVYVAGVLGADPSMDGSMLTGTPGNKTAGFVAKYDCQGALVWLHHYGNHSFDADWIAGLALDQDANVYVCGHLTSGTDMIDTTTVHPPAPASIFLSKLDSNGVIQWTKFSAGGFAVSFGHEYGNYIAMVNNLPVLSFQNGAVGDVFNSGTSQSIGEVLAGFDANGNIRWIHNIVSAPTTADMHVGFTRMTSDEKGNLYLIGMVTCGANPDTVLLYGHTLIETNSSGQGILIKFDSTGTFVWLKYDNTYTYYWDYNLYDLYYANGNLYVTGGVTDSMNVFGYHPTTHFTSPYNSNFSSFALCLNAQSGNVIWGACRDSVNSRNLEGNNWPGISADARKNAYLSLGTTVSRFSMGNAASTIIGSGQSKPFVITIDSTGTPVSKIEYAGTLQAPYENYFSITHVTEDGSLIISGHLSTTVTINGHVLANQGGASNDDIMLAKWGIVCGSNALQPPNPPLDVVADCQESPQGVLLTWFDNSGTETGFHIYRSPNGTTGWSLINTTAANAQTYLDNTVAVSQMYWYRISAFNASGEGLFSVSDSASTNCLVVANERDMPDGDIIIYPNPSKGEFTISIPGDEAEIIVTNMLGQQIMRTEAKQEVIKLQVEHDGVYVVKVRRTKGMVMKKLIVNRR